MHAQLILKVQPSVCLRSLRYQAVGATMLKYQSLGLGSSIQIRPIVQEMFTIRNEWHR